MCNFEKFALYHDKFNSDIKINSYFTKPSIIFIYNFLGYSSWLILSIWEKRYEKNKKFDNSIRVATHLVFSVTCRRHKSGSYILRWKMDSIDSEKQTPLQINVITFYTNVCLLWLRETRVPTNPHRLGLSSPVRKKATWTIQITQIILRSIKCSSKTSARRQQKANKRVTNTYIHTAREEATWKRSPPPHAKVTEQKSLIEC